MRTTPKTGTLPRYLFFVIFLLVFSTMDALGAEGGNGWRASYDSIMLYVNFAILVFLFFKFLKKPLVDFLTLRGETLARDIKNLEDQKQKAEMKSRETMALLKQGESHIENIKVRIIEQGEAEKEKIINDALAQSRFMLENAKQRLGSRILQAKHAFRTELVEAAIALAMEKLPKEITDKDNQVLVGNFLAGLK
ncbi:MAG: ATP synthase F0 subunit B [Pseudomonadota bacterium]